MRDTPNPAVARGVRIAGIVLTVVIGIPFLLLAGVALSSRFGTDAGDPHGYALIFGTFLALIAGNALAFVVPLIFRPGRRARALSVSLIVYVIIAAAFIAALLTA